MTQVQPTPIQYLLQRVPLYNGDERQRGVSDFPYSNTEGLTRSRLLSEAPFSELEFWKAYRELCIFEVENPNKEERHGDERDILVFRPREWAILALWDKIFEHIDNYDHSDSNISGEPGDPDDSDDPDDLDDPGDSDGLDDLGDPGNPASPDPFGHLVRAPDSDDSDDGEPSQPLTLEPVCYAARADFTQGNMIEAVFRAVGGRMAKDGRPVGEGLLPGGVEEWRKKVMIDESACARWVGRTILLNAGPRGLPREDFLKTWEQLTPYCCQKTPVLEGGIDREDYVVEENGNISFADKKRFDYMPDQERMKPFRS